MSTEYMKQQAITELYNLALDKEYITFNDIIATINNYKLSIIDLEKISSQLLAKGCLIRENDIPKPKQEYQDRSRLNYLSILNAAIDVDNGLQNLINEIIQIIPPQTKEVENLILQAQNGNQYARNRIVLMYLKVVVRISLYTSKKHKLPLADTIQDAIIGLIESIDKFDISGGAHFFSYATWRIRQSIRRNTILSKHLVYFPVHIGETLLKIIDITEQHHCEFCSNSIVCPNLVSIIIDKLQCTERQAKKYLIWLHPISCIKALAENNLLENQMFNLLEHLECKQYYFITDFINEEDVLTDNGLYKNKLYNYINRKQLKKIVFETINSLKEQEKTVILLRYGFKNNKEYTLEEIGQMYGLTRERVRQIEAKAFDKLRHPSRMKILNKLIYQ